MLNLVTNGSFEDGLTGWSLGGNTGYTGITYSPEDGQRDYFTGAIGSDSVLSQSVQTQTGQHYALTFWLRNDGGPTDDFSVKWNDHVLTSLVNVGSFGYTRYSFDVVATSGSSTLTFSARQDPSYWELDNVSLTLMDPGPTAINPSVTVALGQTLDLAAVQLANPGLPDDTLRIISDSATTGAATVGHNDLIYTPGAAFLHLAANATAMDTVRYTVSDQYGDLAHGTLNVTVTNVATNIYGGQWGNSVIQGTTGTDIITAYGWNNTIYDNGGNDVVNAGQGQATIYTSSGDVVVNLNGYNNTVTGGDGWVTVTGSQGNTAVTLGNGNDTIVAAGYNNVIHAGNGADTVRGIQGNSVVQLGNGGDRVTAAGYSNQITTGSGNDTIIAGDGNETVNSGGGDDSITLNGWSNLLDAGTGNNMVFINGGGNDTFVLHTGGTDQISGYTTSSGDILDLRQVLTTAGLNLGGSFARLGAYLHVANTMGGDAALNFDATGRWAGGSSTLAVLHGVGSSISSLTDLTSHNALRIA